MIGLIGIIIAVALFIFMAFKGLNLVVSAIISTCIMIIFNGMPIYEVLIGTYVGADGVATGYMTYQILLPAFCPQLPAGTHHARWRRSPQDSSVLLKDR